MRQTMAINEIFPNPTVKQVIFQITFPNLFYLENRIGEIQERIMKDFPKSKLLHRNTFRVKLGIGQAMEPLQEDPVSNSPEKLWQFESTTGTILNITTNSLDMSSASHKTYKLGNDDNKKFRYAIEQVVGTFIEVSKLPIINRIGLRYIDYCPVPVKDNKTFFEWYDSKFPVNQFQIADVESMAFRAIVKKGKYTLGYVETLAQIKGEDKLILDFDGTATDIRASDYLETTDILHEMISEEFERTTRADKGPLYDFMSRQPKR